MCAITRGRTALMAATYANQPAAVDLLLRAGADVDLQDDMLNNPFLYSGAEGLMEILKLTHRAGADPTIRNRYGGVAIIPASEKGHLDAVRYLLEETDVDVNHINDLGWTALLEAVILTDGGPVLSADRGRADRAWGGCESCRWRRRDAAGACAATWISGDRGTAPGGRGNVRLSRAATPRDARRVPRES